MNYLKWQSRNQHIMQERLLIAHLKQLNFNYIKQNENDKKRYRKTLIYGIIFVILFTISIIFLWNCTPSQDEVFAYNYDLSSPITDTECEEYYNVRTEKVDCNSYYLTRHRGGKND